MLDGKRLTPECNSDRGIVFQRYSVFPHLTVLGNVMLGLDFAGSPVFGWLMSFAHAYGVVKSTIDIVVQIERADSRRCVSEVLSLGGQKGADGLM